MPTTRRRRYQARHEALSEWHIHALLNGQCYGGVFENGDRETMKEAWSHYRGELLPRFTKDHPGCRPWAWWEFESKAPRRLVSGKWPSTIATPASYPEGFSFGIVSLVNDYDHQRPDEWELQREYLERLKLLTAEEKRGLKARDNQPIEWWM